MLIISNSLKNYPLLNIILKMLQLALLNFPKKTIFNRASAFPVVRLRWTGSFNQE
jgi:hypothetical protein